MNRDDWLKWRRAGLGGSDIPGILGLSEYATPMSVWFSKVSDVDFDETPAMKRGRMLEPAVLDWAGEELGLLPTAGVPIVSREHEWARMSPDAWTRNNEEPPYDFDGLEAKTVSHFDANWGDPGTDHVPIGYRVQCQWYLAVSGTRLWRLAALSMRQDELRIYEITLDDDVRDRLLEEAGRWWQRHIVEGVRPNLDTTAATTAYLRERYARPRDKVIETGDTRVRQLLASYSHAQAMKSYADACMKARAVEIKQLIAENRGIETVPNGIEGSYRATWARFDVDRLDVKALRKAHPEIAKQFTKTKASDKLTVTRKK